jgi:hypothetical protein
MNGNGAVWASTAIPDKTRITIRTIFFCRAWRDLPL